MNEIRDLIIGIDIGKKYTQICCYYDREKQERSPFSFREGRSQSVRSSGLYLLSYRSAVTITAWAEQSILPREKGQDHDRKYL